MKQSRTTRAGVAIPTGIAAGVILVGGCIVGPRAGSLPPLEDGGAVEYSDATGTFPDPSEDSDAGFSGSGFPNGGVSCLPEAPLPNFGAPVHCSRPPPPISGGTLLVTRDGKRVIAADPDRDAVYVVDLASKKLSYTVALKTGDEPGRLAEDGAGRVHVALRGGGAVVTIDPASGTVTDRRSACPAPRGIAWQASTDVLWVACATGELAALPASGGAATVTHVDRDLRDVIVDGDVIAITRFRSAEVLRMKADGTVARRDPMPPTLPGSMVASHVAWRAVAGPDGAIVSVHQQESLQSLQTNVAGGYGGCGAGAVVFGGLLVPLPPPDPALDDASFGPSSFADASFGSPFSAAIDPVTAVLTVLGRDGKPLSNTSFTGVLPVDVAISGDGSLIAAIAAGNDTPGFSQGASPPLVANSAPSVIVTAGALNPGPEGSGSVSFFSLGASPPVAVAFGPANVIIVQKRQPAELVFTTVESMGAVGASVSLSSVDRDETGHTIFHTHAGSQIACASCHPEGGDDGHVWTLDNAQRRTPSLRGTIAGTAPYHWPGDQKDFGALVHDVYQKRMNGGDLGTDLVGALSAWVESIPAPPAPSWVDPVAVAAGRALFRRSDTACLSCHSGPKFTNNVTVDVGTGGAFQVPPLVGVGWRTPLMHSGCAATIADRFGSCATAAHGHTASLSSADIGNLTAYLETL